MMPTPPPAPRWFLLVVILSALPVFQLPMLIGAASPESPYRMWLWFYPIYVVVAAYLAWQCYPQRRTLAWVLVALMWMAHVCMWTLCFMPLE
ncbi:MAG: hypothetical protein K2H74_07225 [Paramuribaculum sp.]|nr:hypothetical protein [Paramuribaculum sp.]MDE6382876.1 hypothetical protein [Paramuribaculum sp.]